MTSVFSEKKIGFKYCKKNLGSNVSGVSLIRQLHLYGDSPIRGSSFFIISNYIINLIIFQVYHQTKIEGFDASLYETKQIFFDSKDGTRIPMFIFHKKVSRSIHFMLCYEFSRSCVATRWLFTGTTKESIFF